MADEVREIAAYNGHRMLEITGDGFPIRIGLRKAQRIVTLVEQIKALKGPVPQPSVTGSPPQLDL